MQHESSTRPIQSLDRGLLLLEAVAAAARPLSLAELTPVLGLDRSSVFRLANTLRLRGFLVQLPETKQYALGSTIWRLFSRMAFGNTLVELARECVNSLAAQTGETTHLAIRVNREAVLIDHRLTKRAVGVASGAGRCVPLHCTGVGKALLADCDHGHLIGFVGDVSLARFTRRTITRVDDLAKECRRVRERGFAIDDEEHDDGVRCVAAPVRDVGGQIVAALGISAPIARLSRDRVSALGKVVMAVALDLSQRLGHVASCHGKRTAGKAVAPVIVEKMRRVGSRREIERSRP